MEERSDILLLFVYLFFCLFINLLSMQACLTKIRQHLVDLGVSEYGGTNCISRLGQIVGRDHQTSINYFSHVQEQNLLSSGNQTWVFSFPANADSFKNYTLKFIKYFLIWIVGSLIDNKKENMMMIDSPDTAIMTRQWKKKLQKQISVFRQIMLDIGK